MGVYVYTKKQVQVEIEEKKIVAKSRFSKFEKIMSENIDIKSKNNWGSGRMVESQRFTNKIK